MSEFVKEVNGEELKSVIADNDRVLIDFFATWCGPCKMLAPVLDSVASNHPDVKFVKVDVDKELQATREFRVTAMPTLVLVDNGAVANRSVGYMPVDEIEELLG